MSERNVSISDGKYGTYGEVPVYRNIATINVYEDLDYDIDQKWTWCVEMTFKDDIQPETIRGWYDSYHEAVLRANDLLEKRRLHVDTVRVTGKKIL